MSLSGQERFREAVDVLRSLSGVVPPADRIDPRGFQRSVELSLSNALRRAGDAAAAVTHAENAVRISGQDPGSIGNLGLCLLDAGRLAEAERRFAQLIQLAPQAPFGHHGLATVYQRQGRTREALDLFKTAARLTPPNMPLLVEIAETLAALDDTAPAEAAARRAHEAAPSARTDLVIASSLTERGKAEEAEPYAQDAVKREPRSGRAWAMLGVVQQAIGQRENSNESLRESVRLLPAQGSAWYALVQNRNASAEMARQMEEVRANKDLTEADRGLLDYGLGQCYERLGEFKRAFEVFTEANAIARKQKFGDERFDRRTYTQELWRAADLYPKLARSSHTAPEESGPQPIFVVGMIRSGTTLVQQILSCHPEVAAGGEILFWMSNWRGLLREPGSSLDAGMLAKLRSAYLRQLAETGPGKRFVVDKMPDNYAIAGILALVFPEAPIVHLTRNPRDTCVSIFTTANRSRLKFMHDLDATVFALAEYEKLMRRWHELMPGRIFDFAYEELVADQGPTTKRLVELCGLDWNEACLHPENNPHQAATPSITQVKAPVYKTSVGRAAEYEPWMSEAWKPLSYGISKEKRAT